MTFVCTICWLDLPDTMRSTCREHDACEDCHQDMTCLPCIDESREDRAVEASRP